MDIAAVDGDRMNENSKPVDREKVHSTAFALKLQNTVDHSVNNRPVKRLVARLPPAFYTVPRAEWNYGIITTFL